MATVTTPAKRESAVKVREVARALSVSPAHVYRMAERGEIGSVRLGGAVRILPGEVERLLGAQREAT